MKLYDASVPFGQCVYQRALISLFEVHGQFPSCPSFVSLLLPNTYHSAAVTLYTSCYCTIGKSDFRKTYKSPQLKHRQLLKYCPLLSKRHNFVSPNGYPLANNRKHFSILATALYLCGFRSRQKDATQLMHMW